MADFGFYDFVIRHEMHIADFIFRNHLFPKEK